MSGPDLGIVTHMVLYLERYPHHKLLSLPLALRQALLISLPVVDVCAMQQTDFVSGLNMEYVWKIIVSSRTPPNLLKFSSSPMSRFSQSYNELFMELVCSVLFNRNTFTADGYKSYRALVLDLLLSVKGAPIVEQWRVELEDNDSLHTALKTSLHPVGPHAAHLVPRSRYMQYYTRHVSDAELARFILDKCHYRSSQVNIHGPYFARRTPHGMPLSTGSTDFSLLYPFQLLGQCGHSLWFVADDSDEKTSLKTLLLMTCELMRLPSPVLKNMCIHAGDALSLQAHLNVISPFFTSSSTTTVLRRLGFPTMPRPYSGLKELILSADNSKSCFFLTSPDVVATFISSQPNLCRLSFIGMCLLMPPHKMRRLVSALVNFVCQPAMEVLNVVDLSLPFFLFQLITESYLTGKSHRHNHVLFYHMAKICDTDRPFYTCLQGQNSSICMHERQFKYCTLQFRSTHLEKQVLSWLFSPSFQLCFHTLDFHAISFGSADLLGVLSTHPSLLVKHLLFTSLELPLTDNTTDDLRRLLSKGRLKSLTFSWSTLGGGRIFTQLTQALLKQVVQPEKSMSVKSLSVMASGLGKEQMEDVKLFFVALRMQKTLPRLGLDLRGNELTSQHFELLHDVWGSFDSPGKLRVLMCGGTNQLPDDVSCLEVVANKVNLT